MKKIIILGGGFAGLIAAEQFANELGTGIQITLVASNPNFTFYPSLVHLAFGEITINQITFDLAEKMKQLGVRFVSGEVLNIDTNTKKAKITGDDFSGELHYDYLLIAVGRRLATEKVGGFFEYSHHLLGIKAAERFGGAVKNFDRGNIVVGMCPDARLPVPVCETAFALARKYKTDIAGAKVSIRVVFPETIEQAFGGANLHNQLTEAFHKHGIEVIADFGINEITQEQIISAKNEKINYDLLMLVPPFRGQTIVGNLRVASGSGVKSADDSAYAKVDDKMRVADLQNVYAAGDIVAFSGPKFAHQAISQAKTAAKNIISELSCKEPSAVYYHEIAAIIDQGGADSLYLHYGIWDDYLYNVKKGKFWSWAKNMHDSLWQSYHS